MQDLASMAPLVSSTLDVLLERRALLGGAPAPTELPSERFPFPVVMYTSARSVKLRRGYGPWVCLSVLILRRGAGVWAVSAFGRLATVYLSTLAGRWRSSSPVFGKFVLLKNAPGRICTDTVRILSPLPLLIGLREQEEWSRRQELHPHWLRFERRASAGWATPGSEKWRKTEDLHPMPWRASTDFQSVAVP